MVTMPHIAQREQVLWGEMKQISKTIKLPSRKKISLELLRQRLCHISTILFLAGDTANI